VFRAAVLLSWCKISIWYGSELLDEGRSLITIVVDLCRRLLNLNVFHAAVLLSHGLKYSHAIFKLSIELNAFLPLPGSSNIKTVCKAISKFEH